MIHKNLFPLENLGLQRDHRDLCWPMAPMEPRLHHEPGGSLGLRENTGPGNSTKTRGENCKCNAYVIMYVYVYMYTYMCV